MTIWVRRHPRYSGTGESADVFVQRAIERFYFAVRGDRFDRFDHVAQLLGYLKACIHSTLMDYWRREGRGAHNVSDDVLKTVATSSPVDAELHAMDLWARIVELLPDPRDQKLAHLSFVQGFRPAAITEAFPDEWKDARAVSVALYRIRQRLRDDPQIQAMLE